LTNNNVWPVNYCLTFYVQGIIACFASFWLTIFLSNDFEEKCENAGQETLSTNNNNQVVAISPVIEARSSIDPTVTHIQMVKYHRLSDTSIDNQNKDIHEEDDNNILIQTNVDNDKKSVGNTEYNQLNQ